MKAFVGVTDRNWFEFLRARADVDEVNFWQPGGGRGFRALDVGQPFLFKLHSPDNFIVGGGFFAHFSLLPASLAWDAFKEKNGAQSLAEMRHRITRYRRTRDDDPRLDYTIGCIILQEPFFFERSDWISVPEDFHLNIVVGKTYDLSSSTGGALWAAVSSRLTAGMGSRVAEPAVVAKEGSDLYGAPVFVRPRLGQGTFRVLVTDTYDRRCAVTREKALPVLEAAHVRPVAAGGQHRVDNGLLLRSDIHTLFDRGYVTVTSDYQFKVSRRLKDDFDNGEHYYKLNGSQLWVPQEDRARPSREALEWHAEAVYLG